MAETEDDGSSLEGLLKFLERNLESRKLGLDFAEKEYAECVAKAEAMLEEHRLAVRCWQGWYESALEAWQGLKRDA